MGRHLGLDDQPALIATPCEEGLGSGVEYVSNQSLPVVTMEADYLQAAATREVNDSVTAR